MVTSVNCAETTEPIETLFGAREKLVGPAPRNSALVEAPAQIPSREGALLEVILGHAQTCPRSVFSTLFARGQERRDLMATSLLQQFVLVATCRVTSVRQSAGL